MFSRRLTLVNSDVKETHPRLRLRFWQVVYAPLQGIGAMIVGVGRKTPD